MAPGSAPDPGWAVIVPVKPSATGKSRLGAAGAARTRLARAIALDTIAAALRVARVVVVTDDARLAASASGLGAEAVPDGAAHGLDGAVAAGAAHAGADAARAALLGDLPALQPEDLAAALADAARHDRACVADADGAGTTLVTARAGMPLRTAFGAGSFARHTGDGCVPLQAAPSLRRDVDTADDLAAAALLGLGPRTAALLTPAPT